jgi:hypothetical protein
MPFNRLNHSILGEIRPRFALKISCAPDVALTQIEHSLSKDKTIVGEKSKSVIFLHTPSWERHYWSPDMTVRFEVEDYTDYTTVSCLVGPRQAVWALFAFIYAAIGILTLFGGMFGIVEYNTSGSSSWIYVIPTGIVLLSTAFVTAKIGQYKGRDQMLHLISFLYHSLEEITEIERIEHR